MEICYAETKFSIQGKIRNMDASINPTPLISPRMCIVRWNWNQQIVIMSRRNYSENHNAPAITQNPQANLSNAPCPRRNAIQGGEILNSHLSW